MTRPLRFPLVFRLDCSTPPRRHPAPATSRRAPCHGAALVRNGSPWFAHAIKQKRTFHDKKTFELGITLVFCNKQMSATRTTPYSVRQSRGPLPVHRLTAKSEKSLPVSFVDPTSLHGWFAFSPLQNTPFGL